ncbi:uncharacterized protein LOC103571500 [Microplitis demolitor]|uniref:uncharacterized protein LOC103571500 n=1 Tax=Microplitis demolitor TaxID=69319 RepID=UPI0004CCA44D|nr:uncharacterized protein LOC103571500 [Microplitis demolitor]
MFERFLLLEDYVYSTISKCANPTDMLTSEEMTVLKEPVLIMKSIEFAITEISGDSYPTCSVLIPIIHCMTQAINNVTVQTDICQQFQQHLLDENDSKFMKLEDYSLLTTSTIFDRRFKRIHFNSALAASKAISEMNKMIKKISKKKDRFQTKVEKTSTPSDSFWSFHD